MESEVAMVNVQVHCEVLASEYHGELQSQRYRTKVAPACGRQLFRCEQSRVPVCVSLKLLTLLRHHARESPEHRPSDPRALEQDAAR